MLRSLRWIAAWFVVLSLARGIASAAVTEATIEGRVLDDQGRPVQGADVVIRAVGRDLRRHDISGADGMFALPIPAPLTCEVLVLTHAGAQIAVQIVTVVPGERVTVVVSGSQLRIVTHRPAVDPVAAAHTNGPLARDPGLGALVASVPTGAAASVNHAAPLALGAGLTELRLVWDGLELTDPVDGTLPWTMPRAVHGDAQLLQPWEAAPAAGGALVLAISPRSVGIVTGTELEASGALRLPARLSNTVGSPADVSLGGDMRVAHQLRLPTIESELRVVAAQPERRGDPESQGFARELAHASLAGAGSLVTWIGAWEISAAILAFRQATQPGRTMALESAATVTLRHEELGAASVRVRRAMVGGQLSLHVAAFHRQRLVDLAALTGGGSHRLDSGRTTVQVEYGQRLRAHVLGLGLAGAAVSADETGRATGRPGLPESLAAQASGQEVAVFASDEWRLHPALRLELAARVMRHFRAGNVGGKVSKVSTETAVFPSALLRWSHANAFGFATAASAPRLVPLAPLLQPLMGGNTQLAAPRGLHIATGGGFTQGQVTGTVSLMHRRLLQTWEDALSPTSGGLELTDTAALQRRYSAFIAQARWDGNRLKAGASYALSSLWGDDDLGFHSGNVFGRPSASARLDSAETDRNRAGPLPGDRRHEVRAFASSGRWVGGLWIAAGLQARAISGAPQSRLGRSVGAGAGELFLSPRGSEGQTPFTATADAFVSGTRPMGTSQLTVALEGFNISGHRAVEGNDPIAAAALDPDGSMAPLAHFGSPSAFAEPLLLRLRATLVF